jgi:hypothetical protein
MISSSHMCIVVYFVLGFVASFHLLPVIYIVYKLLCKLCFPCIYALYKFCAYLIKLCVRQLSRQNECLGLYGYCYSRL